MKPMILLIVAAVAVAQWLLFAAMAMFSGEKFPKKGMRGVDRMLIVSSIVLALGWIAQIDYASLWKAKQPVASASTTTVSRGSCARISTGMSVDEVRKRMGEPNRSTPDEETRGPGAVTLHYEESRCAVHVFDGKVEFVD
jgi:hypothetical protein